MPMPSRRGFDHNDKEPSAKELLAAFAKGAKEFGTNVKELVSIDGKVDPLKATLLASIASVFLAVGYRTCEYMGQPSADDETLPARQTYREPTRSTETVQGYILKTFLPWLEPKG